jgi:YegS/Rv2252/BmrU family lipid kinase
MPSFKTKIIANPNANLGRAAQIIPKLHTEIGSLGNLDWANTTHPGHAVELAHHAAEQRYELVIAAGGDGTVHEVINGVMRIPAGRRPRLGAIPLGSGNDFSHACGYASDPAGAARQIFSGDIRKVDIARLVDDQKRARYWANSLGIGFDATVTIRSRYYKFLRGFLIYLVAVLQSIILDHHAPRLEVRTDRESWSEETLLLVLCNGDREGGGFAISPQARNNDGLLNYSGIRRVSRPMMLRLLPEVMAGTHERFPQVRSGIFSHLELASDQPLVIHTDGEIYAGFDSSVRGLSIDLLPGELEFLV